MKKLSQEGFRRAKQYMEKHARPVDRAVFNFWFEAGGPDDVMAELALYQNADGGFGHALEPDIGTPSSSAIVTGLALHTLESTGRTVEDPMVRNAVEYLVQSFDPLQNNWRPVPLDTNDYPHAPWWHDENGSLRRTFDNFMIIPRAELVGLLQHFSFLVSKEWLDRITEETVLFIEATDQLGTDGGDDLVMALNLAETPELAEEYRQRLDDRIRKVIPQVVARDPKAWASYSIQPLKLAPSPESIGAKLLENILPVNLDYLIDQQASDGAWDPNWSWGDFYPQAWQQAWIYWRSSLTVNNLLILHAYDRIEGE